MQSSELLSRNKEAFNPDSNEQANTASQALKLQQEKQAQSSLIYEKLRAYGKDNPTCKDRWLLASHAHCFIVLS